MAGHHGDQVSTTSTTIVVRSSTTTVPVAHSGCQCQWQSMYPSHSYVVHSGCHSGRASAITAVPVPVARRRRGTASASGAGICSEVEAASASGSSAADSDSGLGNLNLNCSNFETSLAGRRALSGLLQYRSSLPVPLASACKCKFKLPLLAPALPVTVVVNFKLPILV